MKWPLVLTCIFHILLPHSCILGAPGTGCKFPEEWNGHWFQSGDSGLLTINGSIITTKGRCLESKADRFLIYDTKYKCYRCMVMHQKHSNVLQYKESYCVIEASAPTVEARCSALPTDASLISLFRTGAVPLPCPFKGPLEFTYNQGSGECSSPPSTAEACTDDSRLLFRFQACPDIESSQRFDVELECLATWKEGSTLNMVARLHGDRNTNDEESYRCFIYQQTSNYTWNLAQSADAGCRSLISVTDAAKTFQLRQKKPPMRCVYPSWVVAEKSWVALEQRESRLLTSHYNLTILDRNETRLVCHSSVFKSESQEQFIAKATRGCKNGYVCVMFHRRDEHVIEMQLSNWTQQLDDVCNSSAFNFHSLPYTTFITSDPITRQCPNLGRYEIVSGFVRRYENSGDVPVDGQPSIANAAEVQDVRVTSTLYPGRCYHGVRRLDIGCKTPDRMEFATSCSDEVFSEYWCHGSWIENNTVYLVASTDAGRYCLVYSVSIAATGSHELSVTGHLASCPRVFHHHLVSWQVNLTSYAQCGESPNATTWTHRSPITLCSLLLLAPVLFGRYIAR